MGIIAAIIAAIKGHTTYAVCMGIWTIIAFILDATGSSQYAIAPGGLFVVIAICMKNLRKANSSISPEEKTPVSTNRIVKKPNQSVESAVCEKCGIKLSPEWAFCNNCGYPVHKTRELTDDNSILKSNAEEAQNEVAKSSPIPVIIDTNPDTDNRNNVSIQPILNLDLHTLPIKLRRAYRLIEDEEWDKATEYFDKILDEEPENAYAYLGKAMIKAHVSSPEHITTEEICVILKSRNFARAAVFADDELSRLIDSWKVVGVE